MKKNKLFIILLLLILLIIFVHYFTQETFDLKIFSENKPTYNIGDILNIPSYYSPKWDGWDVVYDVSLLHFRKPHHLEDYMNTYPNSIVYNYFISRPPDEKIPNPERIITSVDKYINENGNKFEDLIEKVSNNNTLTVHLRSGDKRIVEDLYIEIIKKLSENYEYIIILSGIHQDLMPIEECKEHMINSLNKLNIIDPSKIIYNFDEPDVHLSLMRMSSNLLLHKGGFSLIGGLLFQKNNLYISILLESIHNPDYINLLKGNVIYAEYAKTNINYVQYKN